MTAFVPPAEIGIPTPLPRAVVPVIPGGDAAFIQHELDRIRESLRSTLVLLPQSSTRAPPKLMDGMRRLARNPWWPVSGQTADAWVYWDAAGQLWRFEGTAPTTT